MKLGLTLDVGVLTFVKKSEQPHPHSYSFISFILLISAESDLRDVGPQNSTSGALHAWTLSDLV